MISEKRYTVLIIDDSAEDRAAYRRYLQRDDRHVHDILEADSAALGLKIYRETLPDVVVLDYSLPETDGLSLLDLLYQIFKSLTDIKPLKSKTIPLNIQSYHRLNDR